MPFLGSALCSPGWGNLVDLTGMICPWAGNLTDVTASILASPPTQMLAMFTLANCCQVPITMNSV